MESDKEAKERAKLEKKRLKARAKAEKERAEFEKKRLKARTKEERKRAELGLDPLPAEEGGAQRDMAQGRPVERETEPPQTQFQPLPWYKDPNWIRAIVAVATLVVMILTLYFTLR